MSNGRPYRLFPLALGAVGLFLFLGCDGGSSVGATAQRAANSAGYTPELGQIMILTQMRHAKLWFAGQAENWPLASYEIDELQQGFNEAVKTDPKPEGSPIAITEIMTPMTQTAMGDLRNAVAAKDKAAFTESFGSLTRACNSCHIATNHPFNVIRQPVTNPFPNQDFTPPGDEGQEG